MANTIYFPLIETAKVNTVKFPLKETAWIIYGFIIQENIIKWHETNLTLMENIKSRVLLDAQLVDKNHVKISWYGDSVPKIRVFRKLIGEDYSSTPYAILNYSPQEYTMLLDSNGYAIKLVGENDTGESGEIVIGANQNTPINMKLEIPLNEKYYFFDYDIKSEYRIEVNL